MAIKQPFRKQAAWVNGIELRYVDFGGEGSRCLLLHGAPSHAMAWALWVQRSTLPLHFIALEQRGQGDSAKPSSGYAAVDLGHDAAVFWEQLALGSAVVIGASMGGNAAIAMAAERPDLVRALVLSDPAYRVRPEVTEASLQQMAMAPIEFHDWQAVMTHLRQLRPSWSDEELEAYYGANLLRTREGTWRWRYDPDSLRHIYLHFQDDLHHLALAVRAPTLIVQAGQRRILSDDAAQELNSAIAKSRLVTIEDAGHNVQVEKQRDFEQAALLFLSEVGILR